MVKSTRQRRWPAYTTAAVFLGYALGKAVFAAQGRLGFPGGPVPSAAEHEHYAAEMMDVATMQWAGAATGLLAALIVLATVTDRGRAVPRPLLLALLTVALLAVGAGVGIILVDGFVGLGVGWQWYQGLLGVPVVVLLAATTWSYARAPYVRARANTTTLSS